MKELTSHPLEALAGKTRPLSHKNSAHIENGKVKPTFGDINAIPQKTTNAEIVTKLIPVKHLGLSSASLALQLLLSAKTKALSHFKIIDAEPLISPPKTPGQPQYSKKEQGLYTITAKNNDLVIQYKANSPHQHISVRVLRDAIHNHINHIIAGSNSVNQASPPRVSSIIIRANIPSTESILRQLLPNQQHPATILMQNLQSTPVNNGSKTTSSHTDIQKLLLLQTLSPPINANTVKKQLINQDISHSNLTTSHVKPQKNDSQLNLTLRLLNLLNSVKSNTNQALSSATNTGIKHRHDAGHQTTLEKELHALLLRIFWQKFRSISSFSTKQKDDDHSIKSLHYDLSLKFENNIAPIELTIYERSNNHDFSHKKSQEAIKDNNDTMRFKLDFELPKLGRLVCQCTLTDFQINLNFWAEKQKTRIIAQQHSDALKQNLIALGFSIETLSISTQPPLETQYDQSYGPLINEMR